MIKTFRILTLILLLGALFPGAAFAAPANDGPPATLNKIQASVFQAVDWDVPGGHFFTQTGGGGDKGYLVSDDAGIRFWSEFKRLGGVDAVGYPSSQRFSWDGYTVQVFQRVIFQWRPESGSVAFVNVFDRLHELGKDDWLLEVRQTPKPITLNEQGMSWNQVVDGRVALMNTAPAIKAKYFSVVGDPIQANGLPTSAVTDMGNHFALRAQRVVFQLWKEDVPWAKKGQVTVALGGDIAKEAGILPDQAALQPVSAPPSAGPSVTAYRSWLISSIGTVKGSVDRFMSLSNQLKGNQSLLHDPGFLSRLDAEMAIWRRAYQDASSYTPPAAFAEFHGRYVACLRELNGAADLADAVRQQDADRVNAALDHFDRFIDLWNAMIDSIPPGL